MKAVTKTYKKQIMLTVLFTVYMSEYMLSLICMDQSSYAFPETGKIFHYVKMPAVAAGFLLFPFIRKFLKDIRSGRIILLASNILFIAGTGCYMGVFCQTDMTVYIIACFLSLINLGFIGGAVYYDVAMGFVNQPFMGRLTGLGGAVAFLIQIGTQRLFPATVAMLILLVTGFAFTAYITVISGSRSEWMFDEPLEYAQKGDPALPGIKVILAGTAAMILLYVMCGVTDTILVSLNFAGDMSIYAWPRLFGAVGYLTAGFLADLGRRKWLPLSALCMSIMCIPIPFILREGFNITGTCIYYIIAVGMTHFLNVFFWELAPRTSAPRFVAGAGRILCCLAVSVFPLFSGLELMGYVITEILIAAIAILCIALGGYFPNVSHYGNNNSEADAADEESRHFEEFVRKHSLTPRETDFLRLLLESDDDVQSIASNMNISTRTVYRHINSIYEKTGTETRYSLMRYYYKTK